MPNDSKMVETLPKTDLKKNIGKLTIQINT